MGRNGTGIDYTTTCPRLDLFDLLRVGYFTKDAKCSGSWTWNNGDRAEIVTHRQGRTAYMEVVTRWTDYAGREVEARQRIDLHSVPSNLGRGHVLYFICPRTGKLCRILYRAYSSTSWRSREGFSYRLYYPQQADPAWGRNLSRENAVERKLDRLYSRRIVANYRGRPTRRALRIAKLERKLERLSAEGWAPMNMPPSLRRAMAEGMDLGADVLP